MILNRKILPDHKSIRITLKTQVSREFINKIPETKQPKMIIKEFTDTQKQKIQELGVKIFDTHKWKNILQQKDREVNINKVIEEYEKDIWLVASETLEIKEKSNIPYLKPKVQSIDKKTNNKNQNIVIKAILSIAMAIKLQKITKKNQKCIY